MRRFAYDGEVKYPTLLDAPLRGVRGLPLAALFAAQITALATACSSSAPSGPPYTGTKGTPIAALVFENLLLVDAAQGGGKGKLAVDTGSPVVILNPKVFPGAPSGNGSISSLEVVGLTFTSLPVVGANLISSTDPAVPLDGIFGCTAFCGFALSFNYRDAEVTLDATSTPSQVDMPGQSVPFALEGGGIAQVAGVPGTVSFPASRVGITALVEGQTKTFIVDSGASDVFLRQPFFSQLTKDGRTVGQIQSSSLQGTSTTSVARVRSVVVGGAEVDGLPASADASLDGLLDELATEVGHPVDGLLGGTFLREFYVTVDYPSHVLRLQRYATRDHILDEFKRVGVEIAAPDATGNAAVRQVLAGSDAALKGVQVGDQIAAVDGHPLRGLGVTAASALLSGVVGSTKNVTFATAKNASLTGAVVAIRVEEFLRLP